MKTDEHIWNHMLLLFVMNVWTHENLWNIWLLSWLFENIWTHMNTYVVWASWVGNLWKHMDTYETVLRLTWLVGNIWKQLLFLTWMVGHIWNHLKHMLLLPRLVGNIWNTWAHMKTYEQTHTINQPLVFLLEVWQSCMQKQNSYFRKRNYVNMCAQCLGQSIYLVLVDPMFLSSHWFWSDPHLAHHAFLPWSL